MGKRVEWPELRNRIKLGLIITFFFTFPSFGNAGIPFFNSADDNAASKSQFKACSHFSELVSPSNGEIVASGNFVLYVRCLEECGVQGATISIFLNEQFHPDPAVSLPCTETSLPSVIVVTEPPPGLWTATIRTYRNGQLLDRHPFSLSFVIDDPPGLPPDNAVLRSAPWERSVAHTPNSPWTDAYGMRMTQHGSAVCTRGGPQKASRCTLKNAVWANGTFTVVPKPGQESEEEIEPFKPCQGGDNNCWGPVAPIHVLRKRADELHQASLGCDFLTDKRALLFAMPYLGSMLSAMMAGFLTLYATLLEADEGDFVVDPDNTVLVLNLAPPVEAGLGSLLPLFSTLSSYPITSTTELSMMGRTCFSTIAVGLSDDISLSQNASFLHYVTGVRRFVAGVAGVDLELIRHYRGQPTLVLAVRYGRLNRDWADIDAILSVASDQGFLTVDSEIAFGSSSITLQEQFGMLSNCSVLLGVTGEALAAALWMPRGSVLFQVVPFGVAGHFGREYAVLAHNSAGHYLQWDLKAQAARQWPWAPHPTALADPPLYWQQDPEGANILYMGVGQLVLDAEMLASYLNQAIANLQTEAPPRQEMAAAGHMKGWHAVEGFTSLVPERGRFQK